MKFLKDICIGITIAVILYTFVLSISTIITNTETTSEKSQKIFIINFIAGIVLIFAGNLIFNKKNRMKNNAVKYGTILAGCGLMINSIMMNWDNLADNTRIILIGLLLLVVIAYSYKKSPINNETNETNETNNEYATRQVVVHKV